MAKILSSNLEATDAAFTRIKGWREEIVARLRAFWLKTNKRGFCTGSSGGIDSALTLCLACEAIGPENVHAFRMPSPNNSVQDEKDALALHGNLGCHDYLVPLYPYQVVLDYLNFHIERTDWAEAARVRYNDVADQNIQARLRGTITLMHFSNAYGPLVLGTDNKVESYLGYFTLYGDSVGAIRPLGELYKGEVQGMASTFDEIPEAIHVKVPTAGLFVGQTDEAALLPYPILDAIVAAYSEKDIVAYSDFTSSAYANVAIKGQNVISLSEEDYDRMIAMIEHNKFKDDQCPNTIPITR